MVRAKINGVVVAEAEKTEIVEGNHYFPPDAVRDELLTDSSLHTTCPWKGVANYYDLEIDGEVIRNAAWYYPNTKPAAKQVEGYVAFYRNKGVEIELI